MSLLLSLILPLAHAETPVHLMQAEVLSVASVAYSPPPYSLKSVSLEGDWQPTELPRAVRPQRIEAMLNDDKFAPPTVIEWYRLRMPALEPSKVPRYLYIPRWKADGQLAVYSDSRLIYQSHAGMEWNGWNIPLWIPLDETADAVPPKEILLRLQRPRFSGGGISTVWVGNEDAIGWRYRIRDLIQVQLPYMSSAAFLAMGLFAFFVWLRSRDQLLYFLFSLVSLTSYLRTVHFYVGQERFPIPDDWFSWLTVNSLFWMIATVHFFLNYLHRNPLPWLNRTVALVTLTMSAVTLPSFATLPGVYAVAALAYVVLLIMGTTVASVGLKHSLACGSRYGTLLASWGLLGMGFGIYDWFLQNNYLSIEGVYVGPYSNVLAFLIFTYIMYGRYVGAMEEVRQANTTLGERLRAREAELTESHRTLREIEKQQTLVQERQRLMQDMHDGLGSSLVSALRIVEHGQLDDVEIAQVLKSCIDDLKLTIDSMEPVEKDLLLLLATLRFRIAPRLEATGINLRWEIKDVPPLPWLTPRHSLHILRILQETFTNVIKHAQSTTIRVATSVEDAGVVVTLSDDGHGFNVEQALGSGGKGLTNQMRRAEAIGGKIEWSSNKDGTRVSLWLPC
ncbi:MAG TPA: sensor histidine kinase [Rhodocyclaceae bacterium]|nr:sensor histidine kinase [Rhodocyclaceae bacterium]